MASIGQALFPRSTERASIPAYHPRAVLDAAFDVASLPGRAYASLGRPSAESYSDAMARTGPTGAMPGAMYQSEGDEFADMVLRDPFLPLGAMLSAAAPIRALGQYGRAGVEGAFNAGGSMADQYATTGRAELAPSLLAGVAGAAPGILPAGRQTRAAMISPEERDANFRKWFGDSKVVDEAGNPLTVYHGTREKFDAFDTERHGRMAAAGQGAYFTDDIRLAAPYARGGDEPGVIKQVHLSLKNPYPLPKAEWDQARSRASAQALTEDLKAKGYDGVVVDHGEFTGGKEYVAFDPIQIKSATGNRGTFDPSDPNITHLTASRPVPRAATPLQTLGSRLSAQAKHAALREYLSDDRPQGDTHYTSRSRR